MKQNDEKAGWAAKLGNSAHEIILDSISDGVFTVDHAWRIMSFNRAAEEITGITRQEALGRFCWEVFRSNDCEANCALKKTMQEGRSLVNSSTFIINGDFEQIPITVSTSVLRDENGEILGGVETFRDRRPVEDLRRELTGQYQVNDIVSRSKAMLKVVQTLPQIAESGSTALLWGETGTGKELLARTIHSLSARAKKPFVAINCGALPDSLLESELFGYVAGAFTGATKDKPGLFQVASGGTVLLDEIGDTSPAFQVRLLRVLEAREFQPLGSVQTVSTDVRIIAATHRNLEEMVAEGSFRQDLFYRINVVGVRLPPLRERCEDVPLLIERFIARMNLEKDRAVREVAPEAMAILLNHDYPGNVRELENIIEHGVVLCEQDAIEPVHLPQYLQERSSVSRDVSSEDFSLLSAPLHQTEAALIDEALRRNGYNRQAAARDLGIHKATLYRKIKKLGITLPETDGRSGGGR
ncbi:MAG: Fis family transcriptional regulator [Deltaproteobacteria bacterium]|nr:MAG: Fis family transcriptional regulator [Deltaproteobacteria bacterium]